MHQKIYLLMMSYQGEERTIDQSAFHRTQLCRPGHSAVT